MSSMKRNHLPLFGVGPIYYLIIIFFTILFIVLTRNGFFSDYFYNNILLYILGFILIFVGIYLYLASVFSSKLFQNVKCNNLVITGIYSYVRNPIYSCFLFICSGVLLINGNVCLFVLPVIYWLFLTVLMKNTEEKWLLEKYGEEYRIYCRSVNRCIPWFRKK